YWITTTGGLYRFDPNAPTAQQKSGERQILSAELVSGQRGKFYEDSGGKLWYMSSALFLLHEADGKFDFEKVDLNLPENSSTSYSINGICETDDGSLWFLTTWGLARRYPSGRVTFYGIDSADTDVLNSIIKDREGRIWFG